MKLVIGLGNPGTEYKTTRHNAGTLILDVFAAQRDLIWKKHRTGNEIASTTAQNEKVLLGKPLSYMNESGIPVKELARFFKVSAKDIIIIYDDLDLPFGSLRVSQNTSSGGHNGVQSIIDQLHSPDFVRIRIGIGPKKGDAADFVLKQWSAAEKKKIDLIVKETCTALETLITQGIEKAAQMHSTKAAS